jgi:hypothetical protein
MNQTGQFSLFRGNQSVLLGTTTNAIVRNATNYVELKVTFHSTTGAYELRVNGVTWLSATGVNTITSANAYANDLKFTASSNDAYWLDDLYLADTNGSANNDFLGDVRVQCIYPNAAGNYTEFTPNTGLNWAAVDEQAIDGDTTYVSSSTPGQKDSYGFQDLAGAAAQIYGIQRLALARKDDAGTRTLRTFYRTGGVDYESADSSVGNAYSYSIDILEKSPATTTAWTVSDINNGEFGIKVQA